MTAKPFESAEMRARPDEETPLESWKEIAAYLQRDVRTARRWEKSEKLPVHRHYHLSRSSVYAYPSELEAWRANREPLTESTRSAWWRPIPAFASTIAVALVLLVAGSGPQVGALIQADRGSDITVRRVWADKEDLETVGSASPDGRYISFVDWGSGDLAIHDLVSGEDRRLTAKGSWEASSDYATHSLFSSDGKQLVYTWVLNRQSELRIIGTDGSQPRVLYRGDDVSPVSWSPDGKLILIKLGNKDQTWRPVIIAVADGSIQDLIFETPGTMCFSPNGDYIAYDAPQTKGAGERDVYIYELATKRITPAIKHAADDALLGWAPNGKHLLFTSNRRRAWDAWLVTVSRGQPQGEAELVRKDIGDIAGVGFAGSGAYYFQVSVPGHNIYTARLDLDTGKLLSRSEEAIGSYVGSNWRPDFSRDGKFLAYVSNRESGTEHGDVLVIRSLETETERLLRPALAIGFGLCWGPDGRSLFVNGTDNAKREGLFRVDAQTGDASLILEHRFGSYVPGLELSPEGRKLFYTALDEPGMSGYRIISRDLQSGQEQLLAHSGAGLMALALSPDGGQLAFLGGDDKTGPEGIFLMPSSGGVPRQVVRSAHLRTFAWSPDGRYLIYPTPAKMHGTNLGRSQWELWRVAAQGGESRRLDLSVNGLLRYLRVHPDGQRIVYYAWRGVKEVWVMENFLPGPG